MVKNRPAPARGVHNERLIVRWKTCEKAKAGSPGPAGAGSSPENGRGPLYNKQHKPIDRLTSWLGVRADGNNNNNEEPFHGLFIFEFDEDGRILTHTIEHAEETGSWDKASRVVSVTDWLLGRAMGRRRRENEVGGLVWEFRERGRVRR